MTIITTIQKEKPFGEMQNMFAFAAIKQDGSVITWGNPNAVEDFAIYTDKYSSDSTLPNGSNSPDIQSYSAANQLDGKIPVTQIYSSSVAFAALRIDGSVVTWGDSESGGDSSAVKNKLNGTIDVTQIYSNGNAFAALCENGSVVTWGNESSGGNSSIYYEETSDIFPDTLKKGDSVLNQLDGTIKTIKIYSTGGSIDGIGSDLGYRESFAALREDGSVVIWGDTAAISTYSYDAKSKIYTKQSSLSNPLNGECKITKIYNNGGSLVASREDNSIVVWGDDDSISVVNRLVINGTLPGSVKIAVGNVSNSFFALSADGSLTNFGDINSNISQKTLNKTYKLIQICSTYNNERPGGTLDPTGTSNKPKGALALLRENGSVLTFGDKECGGDGCVYHYDSSLFTYIKDYSVSAQINGTIKVQKIYSSRLMPQQNGLSSAVTSVLLEDPSFAIMNRQPGAAFAALREDGSVVTRGDSSQGGNSRSVAKQLNGSINVKEIYTNDGAFAALRENGSVVTWGNPLKGGNSSLYHANPELTESSNDIRGLYDINNFVCDYSVANKLNGTVKVKEIYALNIRGFIALREDGTAIFWGNDDNGKDINQQLSSSVKITKIYSLINTPSGVFGGFAALREDGSVISFNNEGRVIDISGKLKSGVVAFADASTDDFYSIPVISTKPSKGNDLLTGTEKNETLSALAGDDTLIGGLGIDKLTGGLGADTFKFTSANDSGITVKTRDTITDFKSAQKDKIDLSNIDANEASEGDQAFTFINNMAFSADATGQLRFDAMTHILYGSTNADSNAEFSILLSGVKTLTIGDFVL
jgi:Ca2+-binding RTX toxin-like protein